MEEFRDLTLEDFAFVGTLGMGGFGRVELVRMCVQSMKHKIIKCGYILYYATVNILKVQQKNDKTKSYALKCLKKKHIVDTRQQEHIFSEKEILFDTRCPFIARYYKMCHLFCL